MCTLPMDEKLRFKPLKTVLWRPRFTSLNLTIPYCGDHGFPIVMPKRRKHCVLHHRTGNGKRSCRPDGKIEKIVGCPYTDEQDAKWTSWRDQSKELGWTNRELTNILCSCQTWEEGVQKVHETLYECKNRKTLEQEAREHEINQLKQLCVQIAREEQKYREGDGRPAQLYTDRRATYRFAVLQIGGLCQDPDHMDCAYYAMDCISVLTENPWSLNLQLDAGRINTRTGIQTLQLRKEKGVNIDTSLYTTLNILNDRHRFANHYLEMLHQQSQRVLLQHHIGKDLFSLMNLSPKDILAVMKDSVVVMEINMWKQCLNDASFLPTAKTELPRIESDLQAWKEFVASKTASFPFILKVSNHWICCILCFQGDWKICLVVDSMEGNINKYCLNEIYDLLIATENLNK